MARTVARLRRIALTATALGCMGLGALSFWEGALMRGKAALGEVLLDAAWQRTLASGEPARPWPWADVAVSARLDFPRLGKTATILDSASGEAMAWGAVHVEGTASPGQPGLAAFGGHKDSHFAFLEHVKPGDEIILETGDGIPRPYRVRDGYVVDSRRWRFPIVKDGPSRLALSTCWPFGETSQHLRFVLFADRADTDSPSGGGAPVSSTQPQPGGRTGGSGSPARSPNLQAERSGDPPPTVPPPLTYRTAPSQSLGMP